MSAALVILPRVWATADPSFAGGRRLTALPPAGQTLTPGVRKGPHALRLVSAAAVSQAQPGRTKAPALRTDSLPELAFYRKYTEGMLRRYLTLSLAAGRVPSLMGRELFRGNVSHCTVSGFDDVVIFVHDIGKCMERLAPGLQHLVRRIAIQGYSQSDTAAMLGIGLRTLTRRYAEALDQLTAMLIDAKLLNLQTERR